MMKRLAPLVLLGFCALVGGAGSLIPLRTSQWVVAQGSRSGDDFRVADAAESVSALFQRVAREAGPAVVAVDAAYTSRGSGRSSKEKLVEESGSGFIVQLVNARGYQVLTNNHVIAGARPDQITLRMADGRILRPTRIWADPESDVAVLGLDDQGGRLPTLTLGDSDRVRVGQWVLAVGSPFGLNQTVTHGIISARGRGEVSLGSTIRIKDFLQTDAAINPGSSGGPLLNLRGEVIGINTAIASHTGNSSGVAFSIPVNMVKRIATQLLTRGKVQRGYLGMQLAGTFEARDALRLGLDRVQGAWVERIYPNTPAAQAGLQPDDVIIRVDDTVIRNENHLINIISRTPAGTRVRLHVWRNRRLIQLDATVGDWNAAQARFRTN